MMFLGKSETSSPPTLQFSPEGEPAALQPVQAGALQAAGTEEVCPALAASYDPKLNPGGGGGLQSSSSLTSPAPRGSSSSSGLGRRRGTHVLWGVEPREVTPFHNEIELPFSSSSQMSAALDQIRN